MLPTLSGFRAWLDERTDSGGDRAFLEFRGRRWTYADLARITDAIAAALHARGLEPGDRIAITLPNSPEHLFAWLGAAKLGTTVAPLHAQWTPAEVARALAQIRPRLVVGDFDDPNDRAETFIEGRNKETEASIERKDENGKAFIEGRDQDEAARAVLSSPAPAPRSPPSPQPSPLFSPLPSMAASPPLPSSLPSMEAFASSSSSSKTSSLLFLTRQELSLLIDQGVGSFPSVAETTASAPAELLFTSGTTGLPKAAVQSYRSMMLTGEAFADWLRLGPDDRLFTCLPLAHINARFYSTMGALAAGATLVLEERFSASAFWRWMTGSGATVVNTIGAMLRILLQAPPSEAERAHRLRTVYTSPALGAELHREFETRFGVRLVVGYGMTECTFGFIHPLDLPLESPARHLASMGRPRRHPDPRWPAGWRLVDPDSGRDVSIAGAPEGPVSSHHSGEVWLSGPTLFSGYFENEEATASVVTPDGWLRTGDLAERDADGWWTFVGRTKEMIRRRGENVSPLEIEELLMSHPSVAEAAVLGVPSALGEEEIAAFVVAKPGASIGADALRDFCAGRAAKFKLPSEWRFLDALPRTSTNRVAKGELRALRAAAPPE